MWEPEPYVLDLSDVIRLSDDDLLRICAANPDLQIEQNAAGQLEIMSPAGLSSSAIAVKVLGAVSAWDESRGDGILFDGTGGFRLPNGALRAADVAWLLREKWEAVEPDQRDKFGRVVPDFVVEVRSPSDRLSHLTSKMTEWIENGCRLGWLIDPSEHQIHIYRPSTEPETVDFDRELSGENVLPGFTFNPKKLIL